jgi:hypothetical protein
MRRVVIIGLAVLMLALPTAAWACGGLIGPSGNVSLLRTTTLAGYANGNEHYITSFTFAGGQGNFGSLVPLPGIPSKVERGGDWTLQRLIRETQPQPKVLFARDALAANAEAAPAEVILQTKIDALDLTVLKGGGTAVGIWAKDNGFSLPPDAPEVLDFYAKRSPIFLAAKFDADAARERGQGSGEGTPIHLTIPTKNPWVPLRILGLGKQAQEQIQADVYLLTERRPTVIPLERGLSLQRSEQGSESLMNDLRADKGGDWIPPKMWLSYLKIDAPAGSLKYDLAVDVNGASPSRVDAGLVPVPLPPVVAVVKPPAPKVPVAPVPKVPVAPAQPTISEPAAKWLKVGGLLALGVGAAIGLGAAKLVNGKA